MKALLLLFLLATAIPGCQNSNHLVVAAPSGPDTALARQLNLQAHELIRQEKYHEAEPLLHQAIEADPMFGPAHNNLGLVYFHLRMNPQAIHQAETSKHASPNSSSLYLAAWEFENAIKLMPFQPEPRNNLGMVFEAADKFTQAAEAYQRARKIQPDNPEFIGNLARVKIRRGDRDDETRQLLQELLYKDSRPPWRNWAREELIRFSAKPVDPATQPQREKQ